MESKPAKEKVVIVDTLGETEEVGGLKVVVAMEVPGPVLVTNTAEVVAGGVTVVDESVVFVRSGSNGGGRNGGSASRRNGRGTCSRRNSCGGWSDAGCWDDGRDRRISGSDDFGEEIF